MAEKRLCRTASRREVRRRSCRTLSVQILSAVEDAAVPQHPHLRQDSRWPVLHAQHSVEVAYDRQRPLHRADCGQHDGPRPRRRRPLLILPPPTRLRVRVTSTPDPCAWRRAGVHTPIGRSPEIRRNREALRVPGSRPQTTECSSSGHREVEHREVLRIRGASRQFSMADHAARDENAARQEDLDEDRKREAACPEPTR